jgi:ABC-type nitrate/sulfonate/bicarbonate transport system permease component
VVYDYIIILGFTGLLMDRGAKSLQHWLCPWYVRLR